MILATAVGLLAVFAGTPAASAATVAKHEMTANWAGTPTPTAAPFGAAITG